MRFEHAELGYFVPYPQNLAVEPRIAWREFRVEDTDLAFRGPDDTFMAISSHCDGQNKDPAVLGKQLLVGLPNRSSVSRDQFEFAGGHAFSQVVDSTHETSSVQTKTVTWVRGNCVVDWVLAAPESIAAVEAVFDEWWGNFDPGSMPGSSEDVVGVAEVVP
jgi:hypothetical protein